jgi:hypothetical protein
MSICIASAAKSVEHGGELGIPIADDNPEPAEIVCDLHQ